jgi:hypothetical protein
MSELAFNANGESFEFPPEVTDLRTRRMKMRGAPELVYGRDGRPVTVPVTASIDELRDAVGGVAGKYRLDPLNADGKLVEGVPAAYVQIVPLPPEPSGGAVAMPVPATSEVESVLRDAIRTNGELARTVISTFPSMMEAASRLIEAADGAGIARRKPRYLEVAEDEDEDGEDDDNTGPPALPPSGFDVNALVAQVVPVVVMGIMNGKFDLSKLGELLDWRKAAGAGKKAAAEKPATRVPSAGSASPSTASSADSKARPSTTSTVATAHGDANPDGDSLPPLDPAAMAHFLAIQSALGPDEAAMAREVASALSPREMRAWMDELRSMSVPDAVAAIRRHVHPPQGSNAQESVS